LNFGRIIIVSSFVFLLHIHASSHPDNPINYPFCDWNTLSTIHFEIAYPAGHEGLALRTAELAEEAYVKISDYLGHDMSKVIMVVTYPSNHEFQRDDLFNAAGGEANGMIRVQFHGSYAEFQRAMTREFVFAFQHDILSETMPGMAKPAAMRVPLWFSQGLAYFIAYGYDRRAEIASFDIIRKNHRAGIRDVSDRGCSSLARCRRVGQAFFFFVEKQYGRACIGEMLRDWGSHRFLDDVIYAGTGKTVVELDHEWMVFIRSRFNDFKKKHPLPDKKSGSHEEARFAADQTPSAISPDGSKMAYLAVKGACPELVILGAKTISGNKRYSVIASFPLWGRFESVHPADNNISWTGDSTSIVMTARSNGSEYIYFINPENGRTRFRIPLPFSAVMYPAVSRDGRRIAFTGIAGSSEDIYIYDRDTERITRVTDDDFSDRFPVLAPDGRSVIYSSNWNPEGDLTRNEYAHYRHDLHTGKRTMLATGGENGMRADVFTEYHPSYVDPSTYNFSAYHDFINPAWFHIGGAGALGSGYLFFLQFGMSDYLGRHHIVLTSNYSHESRNRNHDINADAAYYYHSCRWNIGLGAFRQASPRPASSIDGICDLRQPHAFGLISMEHYRGYAAARYSFNRFVHVSLRTGVGRYEKSFPDTERRAALRATAGNITFTIEYDNVVRGAMLPVHGVTGRVEAEECIDFTVGSSFTGANIDLQGFILVCRRFMIAMRAAGGSVMGKNRWHFSYYLGGYNTLRGYDMLSLSGRNMLLLNAEVRIAANDWMSFGLPLSGGLGNMAAVAFIDAGSAWDGRLSLSGGKSGTCGDIKMDFGFGIRFAVYPVLIFKLDFAWPFDKRSIKKNDILFSAVFVY
jgi:hypothetical protein